VTDNRDPRGRGIGGGPTDVEGRFAIMGRSGRTYTFVVRAPGNGPRLRVTPIRVDTTAPPGPIRVVIEPDF
jgi:hypothetical protein